MATTLISAAPVDRENNSLELGAAGSFTLSKLRVVLRLYQVTLWDRA